MHRKNYKEYFTSLFATTLLISCGACVPQEVRWHNANYQDPYLMHQHFDVDYAKCQIFANQAIPEPQEFTSTTALHGSVGGDSLSGTAVTRTKQGATSRQPHAQINEIVAAQQRPRQRVQLINSCMGTLGWQQIQVDILQ